MPSGKRISCLNVAGVKEFEFSTENVVSYCSLFTSSSFPLIPLARYRKSPVVTLRSLINNVDQSKRKKKVFGNNETLKD